MLYDPRRSVSCGIVHDYASLRVARHGSVAGCMRLHVARPSAMLNVVLCAQLEARLPRHVVALDRPCQRYLAHAVRWAARSSHLPRFRLDLFPLGSVPRREGRKLGRSGCGILMALRVLPPQWPLGAECLP
jgi:hypothetical protein